MNKETVSYSAVVILFSALFIFAMTVPQPVNAVTRKSFDFIVGVDGDFKAALQAAKSSGSRFYLFFPDGEYNIGSLTGNDNQMTSITTSNISFIGQSADKTVIFNRSKQEGIGITATMHFKGADNLYLQDLSILNKACYGDPSTYNTTGRHVAVMEQGDDIIYKNVKLLSTQDTYYTKGNRTYWEHGFIEGTTDFICGGGDIFFNECRIFINKQSYVTAPATSTSWGYVFMNCTIDGTVSSYKLGRPWSNAPRCVYINTTMKKLPTSGAWGDPMNVVPSLFAEYNSKTASGSAVDLSGRRTTYSKNGKTVIINPVLSADQAAKYTIDNIFGSWHPDTYTRQVSAPVVRLDGLTLRWEDNDSALCWMVFKDNKFFECVTTNSCYIPSESVAKYTVRTANAMGGLGAASNAVESIATTQYSLTTSVSAGEGYLSPDSGYFAEDQIITLTATPAIGWLFDHWSGDITGTDNPATLTMSTDRSVSVTFVKDSRNYYTVITQASAGGSITQKPEGTKLVEGTDITFTAVPDSGWVLKNWSGTRTGTKMTCTTPSLNSDISVAAHFMPIDRFNYEAEAGVVSGADTETKNTGFSGDGYVNFSTAAGSSLKTTVYVDSAGAHSIFIRYANGSDASRTLAVLVNETPQNTAVSFVATSSWSAWQLKKITVTLPQGVSTLTLATEGGNDGPNVDKLIIEPIVQVHGSPVKKQRFATVYHTVRKTLQMHTSGVSPVKVSIYTLDGKRVYSKVSELTSMELPLKELGNGTYLMRCTCNGSTHTRPLCLY